MTDELPLDPFAIAPTGDFRLGARRELELFGAPVELLWLPDRARRPGVPVAAQPALRPDRAERIIADEAVWRGEGCAITPNRYPFAAREVLLWSTRPVREPDLALLTTALELESRTEGAVMINTMGAAASIPRAHLHLVGERAPFLAALPTEALAVAPLQDLEVETVRVARPCPVLVIGVRGAPGDRARALLRLIELRTALAFNVASQADTTWFMPRSSCEIPHPEFPHALGAAELWGRWCHADRASFAAATPDSLARALERSGVPVDTPLTAP